MIRWLSLQRCRGSPASWLRRVNAALLLATAGWILMDAEFPRVVAAQVTLLVGSAPPGTAPIRDPSPLAPRLLALRAIALGAAASLLGVFVSLLVGDRRSRGMRAWLGLVALVSGWLALITTWQDIGWAGQSWRARRSLDGFAAIAASLRHDWPTADGKREGLGPFMAYPAESPATLLLLTPPRVPGGGLSLAAVERSASGALRFQLANAGPGMWLEWHPDGEAPTSFVGGLHDHYPLARFSRLGDGWFLARHGSNPY